MALDSLPRQILVQKLAAIARQAGQLLLDYYTTTFTAARKPDGSLVTDADLASDAYLTQAIAHLTPETLILSEEAGHIPPSLPETFFLVDPLDGTAGFVKKNGQFSVNIALIDHRRPVLGVLYAPFYNRLFCGFWDNTTPQAWEESADGTIHVLHLEPKDIDDTLVVLTAGSSAALGDYFPRELKVERLVHMGSALKFGLIASGEADLYLCKGPTMEWDSAAGHAIVECAGGVVQLWNGQPLTYGKIENGLCNPRYIVSKKWRNL